jgi:hypothetical protein
MENGMFTVKKNGVLYGAVAVDPETGRWFDGTSQEDVTGGEVFGIRLGSRHTNGAVYTYYRKDGDVYQHKNSSEGDSFVWFCAWSVAHIVLPEMVTL